MLDRWWTPGMKVNRRPDGSSLSATAQNRWEQTPNIMSRLEETSPEDLYHESHTASQTRELLTYSDSSELLIEDSSRDEASSER